MDAEIGAIVMVLRAVNHLSPALSDAMSSIKDLKVTGVGDLKQLEATAKSSLDGFGGSLGKASGAVSMLTGALGIGTAAGLITAAAGLASAMIADADALTLMADKTGISVEGLQALRIAGDDAGVSLEAMTGAVTMLQRKLGGDNDAAAAALADLGIELEHFKGLDGAQQMVALSKSVQQIHDPLRVADDLSKIFGKSWAEMLPALKRGFEEVETGAGQMSSRTIAALDGLGDALDGFWRSAKAIGGEALGDILTGTTSEWRRLQSEVDRATKSAANWKSAYGQIVPPSLPADLAAIDRQFAAQEKSITAAAAAAKVHAAELKELATAHETVRLAAVPLTSAQQAELRTLLDLNKAAGENVISTKTMAREIGAAEVQVRVFESGLKLDVKALDDLIDGMRDGREAAERLRPSLGGIGFKMVHEDVTLLKTSVGGLRDGLSVAGDVVDHVVIPSFSTLPKVVAGATQAIKGADDATRSAEQAMRLAWSSMNDFSQGGIDGLLAGLSKLVRAWDNLSTSMKAASVTEAGLSFAASSADPNSKTGQVLSSTAKGAQIGTSVLPGWGTLIGAGVGAMVGALKVSPVEKNARAYFEDWQHQFSSLGRDGKQHFDSLAQVIDKIGKAYAATGHTGEQAQHDLNAALDATHHSAADVEKALYEINVVLAEQAKLDEEIAAALDVVTGRVGDLGSIVDEVGVGLTASMRDSLSAMLEMPGVTDEIRASIRGLTDSASPDFARLEDMAQGYGVELGQLGPVFQQAHVSDLARQIISDFTSLMDAGADFNGVLGGMADEVSEVVQQSIAFGTTVPENMRGMIEELIKSGQLLGENGEKITDITALHFGDPVKTDVEKIEDAIKALREAIEAIPGALAGIPANIPNPFANWHAPDVMPTTTVDMADGGAGRATGPTLFYTAGNEDWAFSGEGRSFGGGGSASGGSAPATVHNHHYHVVAWDGESVERWMRNGGDRQMARLLTEALV